MRNFIILFSTEEVVRKFTVYGYTFYFPSPFIHLFIHYHVVSILAFVTLCTYVRTYVYSPHDKIMFDFFRSIFHLLSIFNNLVVANMHTRTARRIIYYIQMVYTIQCCRSTNGKMKLYTFLLDTERFPNKFFSSAFFLFRLVPFLQM